MMMIKILSTKVHLRKPELKVVMNNMSERAFPAFKASIKVV
jgi:hypothetical protein